MEGMNQYDYGVAGQALGLDPFSYEENFSSLYIEDFTKLPFSTYLTSDAVTDVDMFDVSGDSIMESLCSPTKNLFDNHEEPTFVDTVDLSAVDELAHLFNDESMPKECGSEIIPDLPSPISSLPSEPSSPVNLETLMNVGALALEQHNCQHSEDLDVMLQNLSETISDNFEDEFADLSPYSPDSISSSNRSCSESSFDEPSITGCASKSKRKKTTKKTPYSKLPALKKERKKKQNKEAANRYRMKKKSESLVIVQEEAELLERNSQLKSDVENLQREIQCMKELLSDVFNVHSFH